jgi:hypothetical protein
MLWQDWYQNVYLESEHWKAFRAYILSTRPLCQICKSPFYLQVHHRNYRCLWHETPNDAAVLCKRCHKMISSESPLLWRALAKLFRGLLFGWQKAKGERRTSPLVSRPL